MHCSVRGVPISCGYNLDWSYEKIEDPVHRCAYRIRRRPRDVDHYTVKLKILRLQGVSSDGND